MDDLRTPQASSSQLNDDGQHRAREKPGLALSWP